MGTFYNPKIITDGLVLHLDAANKRSYPGNGTSWYDLSSAKNHLYWSSPAPIFRSYNNTPVISTSTTYTALRPIKSTTYNGMRTGTGSYSVVCVFKPNLTTSGRVLISFGPADSSCNGQNVHPISTTNSKFVGGSCNGYGTWNNNSGQTITTDRFWHMCTTYDGTTERIYINGYLDKSSAMSSNTPISANNAIAIGWIRNDGASYSMNAEVAVVLMYNRTLSQSEILQNFNATKSRYGL